MSSSSSAGSNSNIITTKSLSLSANTLLTSSNNNNFNSNYDTISVGSSTSSSSANGGNTNSNNNKFINSFKSLFDIFDPNNRGYIDLNELELLGANQNEILNDIICYLKQEKETLTTSLQQQSILINTNISKTPSKTPTNVNKARNRSSLYYQTKIPYFVTFETFVNAADAVLRKRKLAKTQQKQQSTIQQFQTPIISQQQQQQNHQAQFLLQQFQTPIITQQQQQQQQPRLQYKSAIATTTSSARATTQRTNHQKTTLSDEFNSNENLAQSTTSNSTTISNLSNSTTSSNSTTIHTNVNVNVNASNGSTNSNIIINNANSCDLNILLEQETCLLNEGLIELNKLKLYYEQKLSENELKKANILKLKHQNLFSIDKMLLNLKEITNLNTIFNNFISKHLNTDDCDLYKIDKENLNIDYLLNTNSNNNINAITTTTTTTTNGCINTIPSTVQSASPVDDTNNLINTYNTYIKEKQNRIEYLQNQKSMLIRKLFEMKSMSNNSDSTKRQTIACPNITDKTEFISGTTHVDENTEHEDFLFE